MTRIVLLLSFVLVACGGKSSGSGDGGTGDGNTGGDGSVGDGGVIVGGDGGTWECFTVQCNGKTLECNDCIDNDGDGEVDSHDRECLGPCDNTEGPGLNAGVGGETGGPCKADCYFDFGNGPGNDDCHWDHRCDPLAVAPNYPPEGANCAYEPSRVGTTDCPATQSAQCHNFCSPLTPNACDCFGCCAFPELATAGPGGGQGYVWIGALNSSGDGSCTFADITDQTKCPTCTPVADCYNPCDTCEVCIGAPPPPPSCTPGEQCQGGLQPCGLAGQAGCAAGSYCVSGCCQFVIQ